MSVLNKIVSFFPSTKATDAGVDMNLLTLLQSNKHRDIITYLRGCDEAEQKRIKNTLPCYTVAGTFSTRSESGLITLSGLACVDLDSAEDYDISYLLSELRKIDSLAYAGLSCRGQRLFCIVPFLYPDKYVKHYEMLIKSFERAGLPMGDKCHKQISQPRFSSWNDDSTQFFRHDAKPYHLLPPEKTYHIPKLNKASRYSKAVATPDNAFQWCMEQINKRIDFIEGQRHGYMVQLARYCNVKGLQEHETLSGCLQFIQQDFSESEIKSIVRHVYDKHKDSHAKHPFTTGATGAKGYRKLHLAPQTTEDFNPVTYSKLLDLNESLNRYEADKDLSERAPKEIWDCFWKLRDNPNDADSYKKLNHFISSLN